MAPRTILICGFGPFPGVPANPSGRLARRLPRLRRPALGEAALHVLILPTLWHSVDTATAAVARRKPDIVLMLGVASRRRFISIETRAVNAAADLPDAARRHPAGRALVPGAPAVRRIRADAQRLRHAARRLPVALSRDAGRYLCNAVYFHVLQQLAAQGPEARAVFVHLPGPPKGHAAAAAWEARIAAGLSDLLVALIHAE